VSETATLSTLTVGSLAQGSSNVSIGTGSSLRLNGTVTVTPLPGLQNSAGATITGAGALELVTTAGSRSFTVNDSPADSDLTISATVANGGALGGVTKAGLGRLTFSGSNTYGGTTSVSAGVLRATNSGALGTGTGANEVQTISTIPTSGTFTLSFGGIATAAIAFNADATAIQTALEAVVGTGNVVVTGNVAGPFTATFQGALGNTNVEQLTSTTTTIVFGTTTAGQGGVDVTSGASLELDGGLTINNETVILAGTGIVNGPVSALNTGITGTGALRSLTGSNLLNGSVVINGATGANDSIAVDSGTLTVSGNIFQQVASINLVKSGLGTLEMAGSGSNAYGGTTFSGWVDDMTISQA
jgi:autotransporter-associated beta strand protein